MNNYGIKQRKQNLFWGIIYSLLYRGNIDYCNNAMYIFKSKCIRIEITGKKRSIKIR